MIKKCKSCDEDKQYPDQFYYTSMRYYSDICQECKDWTKQAQQAVKEGKFKNLDRARSHRNREFVWTYLDTHPCIDCGEDDPIVLEFDHLDPELKIRTISEQIAGCSSIKAIKTEIAKCEVVCANCHKKRTARQFSHRKLYFCEALRA